MSVEGVIPCPTEQNIDAIKGLERVIDVDDYRIIRNVVF